jgi:plasmid stability protein
MPTITIRKFSEGDKRLLRIRAAHNNHSMEEEARQILHATLQKSETPVVTNLADKIRQRFEPLGGVDLPEIKRDRNPEPPEFS